MKKNSPWFAWHLLTCLLLLIMACSKTSMRDKPDQNELNKDANFISLVEEMNQFSSFLSGIIKEKSLSSEDLQQSLGKLQASNYSTVDQLVAINKIFGANVSNRLTEHMKMYNENWSKITARFGTLSYEILKNACEKILAPQVAEKQKRNNNPSAQIVIDPPPSDSIETASCGWRYYLCGAAATAAAIGCHAACISGTVGFGTPACVALCGSIQVYAMTECKDKYCGISQPVLPPLELQPIIPKPVREF